MHQNKFERNAKKNKKKKKKCFITTVIGFDTGTDGPKLYEESL